MSKPNKDKLIPLSSIDHIFTGIGSYPIEFIFSYQRKLDEKTLKSSLLEAIKYFPPVSSKLVKLTDQEYGFELSSDGLIFEVKESRDLYEECDTKYKYINPVHTIEGESLTKIRITHTPGGSVLGVSISHAIADGFSYFHFLSSWAKLYKGKSFFPPIQQRSLLVSNLEEINKIAITRQDVLRDAGLFLEDKRGVIKKEDLKWESRIFHFMELKELLAVEQERTKTRLSFNDIITAQLSKEYLSRWQTNGQKNTCYISCPVDFRRILDGFPKTYFGNAVSVATTPIVLKDLNSISLSELAIRIRTNVKNVVKDRINTNISCLTTLRYQQNINIFENIHVMHPESGLLVTNLSKLPVPEIEFNAGPPSDYSILTQSVRGAVILPHPDGFEVRVCCPVE
jgi:shikimate O-hydroxycinnamoyltransferase